MKSWIFNIVTCAFFSSIITLILPEGKTTKTIKSVIALLFVMVILGPIVNFDQSERIFDEFYQNDITIQTSYLDYFNEQIILDKQKKCEKILESYGINNSFISLAYEIDDNNTITVKKIQINLKNSVINSDKDNINIIARAKNAIKNFLLVDEEQIEIYE